jgi:hypothetical protein
MSAYVRIRQRTSANLSMRHHTSSYVSTRQHASEYVSIRRHTSAHVSTRQHTSAHVSSIRQHTSAYVEFVRMPHTLSKHHYETRSLSRVSVTYASFFTNLKQIRNFTLGVSPHLTTKMLIKGQTTKENSHGMSVFTLHE